MTNVVPPEDNLATITRLSLALVTLTEELAAAQAVVDTIKEKHDNIAQRLLPDLIGNIGLSELTMRDGTKITLKKTYYGNIAKMAMPQAAEWLKARNMGGVLKESILVDKEYLDRLVAANVPFEMKTEIHNKTLGALVKEQIEAGNEFPRELFGVHVENKAVVKNS